MTGLNTDIPDNDAEIGYLQIFKTELFIFVAYDLIK